MFVSVCLFWGLFGLLTEDIRLFAFHLFSYKLRIVDRLQNVDDRQSLERARHGLKKKHSPPFYWVARLLSVTIACYGYRLSKITLMTSPYLSPIASSCSWFLRLLLIWGMMCIRLMQANVGWSYYSCRPATGKH